MEKEIEQAKKLLDFTIELLLTGDTMQRGAQCYWKLFKELQVVGFTREEALAIVSNWRLK